MGSHQKRGLQWSWEPEQDPERSREVRTAGRGELVKEDCEAQLSMKSSLTSEPGATCMQWAAPGCRRLSLLSWRVADGQRVST